MNNNFNGNHQIYIKTERDLHTRIVAWIRKFFPELMLIPGLGELQTTDESRMEAWAKGYTKGTPDIIILNNHSVYRGLCIELKSPTGNGTLSESQATFIASLSQNKFQVIVSNDYDEIVHAIEQYTRGIAKGQSKRGRKKNTQSLSN